MHDYDFSRLPAYDRSRLHVAADVVYLAEGGADGGDGVFRLSDVVRVMQEIRKGQSQQLGHVRRELAAKSQREVSSQCCMEET